MSVFWQNYLGEDGDLIIKLTNFAGYCHNCGAELRADALVTTPLGRLKNGNVIHLCIGELVDPKGQSSAGHRFVCHSCNTPVVMIDVCDVTNEADWLNNITDALNKKEL